MPKTDDDIQELHRDIALRFKALGGFFSKLGTEKATSKLLEAMIGGDAKAFGKFVDQLILPKKIDFPKLGKCLWLQEMLETVLSTPKLTLKWAIRLNLTPAEVFLLSSMLRIMRRELDTTLSAYEDRWIVPEGDLLDELKRNGLVEQISVVEHEIEVFHYPGPPSKICL